jgi:hypothetical protein
MKCKCVGLPFIFVKFFKKSFKITPKHSRATGWPPSVCVSNMQKEPVMGVIQPCSLMKFKVGALREEREAHSCPWNSHLMLLICNFSFPQIGRATLPRRKIVSLLAAILVVLNWSLSVSTTLATFFTPHPAAPLHRWSSTCLEGSFVSFLVAALAVLNLHSL